MPIDKILIVEDEYSVRQSYASFLRRKRYEVAEAEDLTSARRYLNKGSFDLVISDFQLPDGWGIDLLKEIQEMPEPPLVIMMSAVATMEDAQECINHNAFDYLVKPIPLAQLDVCIRKAQTYSRLEKVNQALSKNEFNESKFELIGNSSAMVRVRELIKRVAPTDATILIQGESGTGKELVARSIYLQSNRSKQPYMAVNVASVANNVIESEFFGHEKGAFTGALQRRIGLFELAHQGSIFLDEISEVTPEIQAKLLRVLQEQEIRRVGGDKNIPVNVRIIAATNRNLEESVRRNDFREDLFFRLNVIPIEVPPLRERGEDVILLAEKFLARFNREVGARAQGFTGEALKALRDHHWPGNVRELENTIQRAVILSHDNEMIAPSVLGLSFSQDSRTTSTYTEVQASPSPAPQEAAEPADPVYEDASGAGAGGSEPLELAEVEKMHILKVLGEHDGNRTKAADALKISVRTLRNKLNEYRDSGDFEG